MNPQDTLLSQVWRREDPVQEKDIETQRESIAFGTTQLFHWLASHVSSEPQFPHLSSGKDSHKAGVSEIWATVLTRSWC